MAGKTIAKFNQRLFLLVGILTTSIAIYSGYVDIMKGIFPKAFFLLALGISQLMFAYLAPHLFPKDERAKAIIGQAMSINYFVLFGSILILYILTSARGPFALSSSDVLMLLFSIMVVSIPGTMIVYTKRI